MKEYLRIDADITISIHAPVKGATKLGMPSINISFIISIHAPVKGATSDWAHVGAYDGISIHAPVKGATECKPRGITCHGEFQSTHP